MNPLIRSVWCVVLVSAAACGSSGGSTLAPNVVPAATGPVTVTLSGTTRQTMVGSATGCSGDSHTLTMADGAVSITLLETSDPAAALSVQICQGPADVGICSISQRRINVAQTVTGTRTGASNQVVKMLPFACVFGSTFDPAPITYKVSVTYQQ